MININNSIIKTEQLTFSFDNSKIIKNISFEVPKESIYGFLGPNGAGKTTMIKLLLGLLKPDTGDIYYYGKDFNKNRLLILEKTGAMIETPSLYEHLSAWDNLEYLRGLYNKRKERIEEILDIVKLSSSAHKKVKKYSLGMKQRLAIGMTLFNDPDIVILDEPANGLDPSGIYELRQILLKLQNQNKTIFLSSHLLSEVEKLCTHIGIINNGELIFKGSIDEIQKFNKHKVLLRANNPIKALEICCKNSIPAELNHQNLLQIRVCEGKEFNEAIRVFVNNNIEIYSIEKETGVLEELFISLIKNKK